MTPYDLGPGQHDPAIDEVIQLVPYDAGWVAAFLAERCRLLTLFPAQLERVEHIGSTAVPGMPAKPVIDILAGVASMAVADATFEPILHAGYTTSRAFNAMLPDRRWFMRTSDGRRTHHLHVVVADGKVWRERLDFRDALRASAALARDYADLKRDLAARFRHDREGYTDAKSAFVARVLAASTGRHG